MRRTMVATRDTSESSAAPARRFTTLRTGQPMLMSTRSGRCSAGRSHSRRVASAITPGSEPKSWMPIGRSHGSNAQYSRVARLPRVRPSAETISV
jgi:hypothetical protein